MQEKGRIVQLVCWSIVAVLQGIVFFLRIGDQSYSVWLTILHGVSTVAASVIVVKIILTIIKEKAKKPTEA